MTEEKEKRLKSQDGYRAALRYLMDERGWKWKEVAHATGLNAKTVSLFAIAQQNLSEGALLELAQGFGCKNLNAFLTEGNRAALKFEGWQSIREGMTTDEQQKTQDSFRAALRYLMDERGWGSSEVADATGLNATTLLLFVNAANNLSEGSMLKLAAGFGCQTLRAFLAEGDRAALQFEGWQSIREGMTTDQQHKTQDGFRAALRFLMDERDWSWKKVDKATGLDAESLQTFVCAARNLSESAMLKLAQGFGCPSLTAFLVEGNRAAIRFNGWREIKDKTPKDEQLKTQADFRAVASSLLDKRRWGSEEMANIGIPAGRLQQFIHGWMNLSEGGLLKLAEGFGFATLSDFRDQKNCLWDKYDAGSVGQALSRFRQESPARFEKMCAQWEIKEGDIDRLVQGSRSVSIRPLMASLRVGGSRSIADFLTAHTPSGDPSIWRDRLAAGAANRQAPIQRE